MDKQIAVAKVVFTQGIELHPGRLETRGCGHLDMCPATSLSVTAAQSPSFSNSVHCHADRTSRKNPNTPDRAVVVECQKRSE